MNIFRYLRRPICKQVFVDHIDLFASYILENGDILQIKILTLKRLITSSTDSMIRLLNGSSRTCGTIRMMSNSTLRWGIHEENSNDLEIIDNDGLVAGVITKSEIERTGLPNNTVIDIIIELGHMFKDISRHGRMPDNYRAEEAESERPIDPGEAIPKSKKQSNLVDDIPEDVFTMESIIDRIRNCGAVADAKHVPVIIRFGEQKLMITDTSIENDFLYFDVVEVPKKELPISSLKFSDYFNTAFAWDGGGTTRVNVGNITMNEINSWAEIYQAATNTAASPAT